MQCGNSWAKPSVILAGWFPKILEDGNRAGTVLEVIGLRKYIIGDKKPQHITLANIFPTQMSCL